MQKAVNRRIGGSSCLLPAAYCLLFFYDPAAAEHFVAAIKYRRLAGRDRALRLIKRDVRSTLSFGDDGRWGSLVPVPDTYLGTRCGAYLLRHDPINSCRNEVFTC